MLISDKPSFEYIEPVTVVRTGNPGRPRKRLNPYFLAEAMKPQRNITVSRLAREIGIHRHTLKTYMVANGVSCQFHTMDDNQLDQVVQTIKETRPQVGLRYLIGHLRTRGLRVQIRRVVRSLHRVDPVGSLLRKRLAAKCRQYHVRRPNSVWHLDGHHKLIAWGIVIHGLIDGYSRLVCEITLHLVVQPVM